MEKGHSEMENDPDLRERKGNSQKKGGAIILKGMNQNALDGNSSGAKDEYFKGMVTNGA